MEAQCEHATRNRNGTGMEQECQAVRDSHPPGKLACWLYNFYEILDLLLVTVNDLLTVFDIYAQNLMANP